jgi:hypothetical protein
MHNSRFIAILSAWFLAGPAHADTCTAPNHPTCSITCPMGHSQAGCAAIFIEGGACRAMCAGLIPPATEPPFSGGPAEIETKEFEIRSLTDWLLERR